jgi:hypothetical protein
MAKKALAAKSANPSKANPPNTSSKSELRIHCNNCAQKTFHDRIRDPYEPPSTTRATISWQLIECRGCQEVAVYRVESEEGSDVAAFEVHPLRERRRPQEFVEMSPALQAIYEETIGAFNSSYPRLCAGGLRALVEGICADQKIKDGPRPDNKNGKRGNTLDCKIEGLAEADILTRNQAKVLHEHRFFGNMAMHELTAHEESTLEKLIDVVEITLSSLYDLPTAAKDLGLKHVDKNTGQTT